jgi:hypothetical protein
MPSIFLKIFLTHNLSKTISNVQSFDIFVTHSNWHLHQMNVVFVRVRFDAKRAGSDAGD